MRIIMLMSAAGWASFSPRVYESSDIRHQLSELAAMGAEGWAIPVATSFVSDVMDLWVSTELGNGMLKVGPNSDVLARAFMRLGQTEDGHLAVQFLEQIPADEIMGAWNIAGRSEDWVFDTNVKIGETCSTGEMKRLRFSLGVDDVALPGIKLSDFKTIWPTATMSERNERLMISCAELTERNGVAATITIGGIAVGIRKMDDFSDPGSDMCATNLRFSLFSGIIGRSFLNQHDVLLDGRNRRLHVLSRRSFHPQPPLMKYRMDSQFKGSTGSAWRWIHAPGPVKKGDFLLTHIDLIFPQSFGVLCFTRTCGDSLLPYGKADWVGEPVVDLDFDGIEFSENIGWESYELRSTGTTQTSRIEFRNIGFRMKADLTGSVEGVRLKLFPIRGEKRIGEFTVPVWPPVVESGIMIKKISKMDVDNLLQLTRRWLGRPRFEVLDDQRILITADETGSECDRAPELRHPATGGKRLDFSVEICKFRQIDLGAPGYAFEPLARSSTDMNELEFKIEGTTVLSANNGDPFSFHTWAPSGADRWSPDLAWTSDPVTALDPVTRMITITPSGPVGWQYSHRWRILSREAAYLEIKPIGKRLTVSGTLSLTDEVWRFIPANADSDGPQFTINKYSFWRKEKDGSLALLFEDVSGQIFTEPLQGIFVGIPTVVVLDSGALEVRPKEGFRPTFNVVATYPTPQSLMIKFIPTEYTRFGSIPTKTENSDEICGICHEELDPEETVAKTKCRHYYHISCLRRIEQRVCPYCRTSLDLFRV